ncbi:MAG: hypothetical protein K8S56_00230 [Candidatus Cloacimonetes bacterium]|nr:hypothetical protein [Candidatus Cloacimonadota bacterium]
MKQPATQELDAMLNCKVCFLLLIAVLIMSCTLDRREDTSYPTGLDIFETVSTNIIQQDADHLISYEDVRLLVSRNAVSETSLHAGDVIYVVEQDIFAERDSIRFFSTEALANFAILVYRDSVKIDLVFPENTVQFDPGFSVSSSMSQISWFDGFLHHSNLTITEENRFSISNTGEFEIVESFSVPYTVNIPIMNRDQHVFHWSFSAYIPAGNSDFSLTISNEYTQPDTFTFVCDYYYLMQTLSVKYTIEGFNADGNADSEVIENLKPVIRFLSENNEMPTRPDFPYQREETIYCFFGNRDYQWRLYPYEEDNEVTCFNFSLTEVYGQHIWMNFLPTSNGTFQAFEDFSHKTSASTTAGEWDGDVIVSLYQAEFVLPDYIKDKFFADDDEIQFKEIEYTVDSLDVVGAYDLMFFNNPDSTVHFISEDTIDELPILYLPYPVSMIDESIRLFYQDNSGDLLEYNFANEFDVDTPNQFIRYGNCCICFVDNQGKWFIAR